MATVTPVTPPVGVTHAVIGVLATADTWTGTPELDVFATLLDRLPERALHVLPAAMGESLWTLRRSEDALQLALDVVVAFDLHEATPGLLPLLREESPSPVLLAAAKMATHPAAPDRLLELVQMQSSRDRRVALLLGHRQLSDPQSQPDRLLLAERLPGRVPVDHAAAPVVVIADDAGGRSDELRFGLELRRAGAMIRRMPHDAPPPETAGWLPSAWGVAVAGRRPAWWPSAGLLRETGGSLTPAKRREVLRWLRGRLSGRLTLRSGVPAVERRGAAAPLQDVDAFFDGALLRPESVYLTGWSGGTIAARGRQHEVLRPREVGRRGLVVYDFAQVTALRVEKYVSDHFGGRRPGLAAQIVERSRAERQVPTHVRSNGEVVFEEQNGFVTSDRQAVIETALVDIAASFEVGGGRTVPGLLEPSTHTRVHPAVVRGTPTLAGTRIPATAVRDVMEYGEQAGRVGKDLNEFARQHLGSDLTDEALRDARRVGLEITA